MFLVALLVCLLSVLAAPESAHQVVMVSEVRINDFVTLSMDQPITEAEAEAIRQELGGGTIRQGSEWEIQTIGCGDEIPFSDANGTWQLRFQCFPTYGVVNWHYNLSPRMRAIAASWVTEDGLPLVAQWR
ncbi:hypothetical protein [Pseudonocardia nigra]|uniref:hypothetical protein n=1 Tax=Pseudonocardia nigra TaxID=1921578 RepID=UPI001C5DBC11|nr:hypothetical protein [Pseudonocardia nigra]